MNRLIDGVGAPVVIGSVDDDDADCQAVIQNVAAGLHDTTGWAGHTPLSGLFEAFDELRRAIRPSGATAGSLPGQAGCR